LETSFLDEKVCLGKQNRQYSAAGETHYEQRKQTSFSKSSIIIHQQHPTLGTSEVAYRKRNAV
jgi:hypothetical protein